MPVTLKHPAVHYRFRIWSVRFALATLTISLLVLTGWAFNVSLLKGPLSQQVLMNPITALSILLISIAILLLNFSGQPPATGKLTAHFMLLIAFSFALWKLLNSVGIINKPIDHLLFYNEIQAAIRDGKLCVIPPVTVACLLLTSLAGWVLPVKTRTGSIPAQYLALLVITIAFFSLLSHLYRIEAFYGIFDYIPMPLYSAISFTLLALSIFAATGNSGLMDIFSGSHSGSVMARFVVPAVLLVPTTFGLLRLYGHWTGIFTTEFGVGILVLSIIAFFLTLTWYTARLLNARDKEKEMAAQDLQKTRAETQYQAQLLQNISDAVISTDVDFIIVSWNKAAEQMYGWRADEVLGRTITEVLKPTYEKETRDENRFRSSFLPRS
jgi:PAS domain-containing protein